MGSITIFTHMSEKSTSSFAVGGIFTIPFLKEPTVDTILVLLVFDFLAKVRVEED